MVCQIFGTYYEDYCADELRRDPVLSAILGKEARSQPILSRFFNCMDYDTLRQIDDIMCQMQKRYIYQDALVCCSLTPTFTLKQLIIAPKAKTHHSAYLRVFLDNGDVPMDNNLAEQAIRPFYNRPEELGMRKLHPRGQGKRVALQHRGNGQGQ